MHVLRGVVLEYHVAPKSPQRLMYGADCLPSLVTPMCTLIAAWYCSMGVVNLDRDFVRNVNLDLSAVLFHWGCSTWVGDSRSGYLM